MENKRDLEYILKIIVIYLIFLIGIIGVIYSCYILINTGEYYKFLGVVISSFLISILGIVISIIEDRLYNKRIDKKIEMKETEAILNQILSIDDETKKVNLIKDLMIIENENK